MDISECAACGGRLKIIVHLVIGDLLSLCVKDEGFLVTWDFLSLTSEDRSDIRCLFPYPALRLGFIY